MKRAAPATRMRSFGLANASQVGHRICVLISSSLNPQGRLEALSGQEELLREPIRLYSETKKPRQKPGLC